MNKSWPEFMILVSVLSGFWGFSSGPVRADDLLRIDASLIEVCLENVSISQEDGVSADPHDCIGLAASACTELPGGLTTAGMADCARQERDLWDTRLNRAYGQLIEDLGQQDGRVASLRQVQRDWIAFRDSSCDWEAGQYEGGSMRPVVGAGCFLRMTAERALWLQNGAGLSGPY